jgi:chemotaxis protein CheX
MISSYLDVFTRTTSDVLMQLGISPAGCGQQFAPRLAESNHELLVLVGLAHDIRGNVVFSMSEATAMAIATTMLCGIPSDGWDDLKQSAIREFANMSSGSAVSALPSGIVADITPPMLILGQRMSVMVSPKEVMAVKIDTALGEVEICLGLTR